MSPVSPDDFQPLQLKGEILDLEFTVDTDHKVRPQPPPSSRLINRPSSPLPPSAQK